MKNNSTRISNTDEPLNEAACDTQLLLGEALGKCNAYAFCLRQLDSLEILEGKDQISGAYQRMKAAIERRYHEATDDWQAFLMR